MQYIVLLRGVNVGGRKIRMADLKALLINAGFSDMHTILQTGNIILNTSQRTSAAVEKLVQKILQETYGYPAKLLVLTPDELSRIAGMCPFEETPDRHRYVVFTKNHFENQLVATAPQTNPAIEKMVLANGVVFWTVNKGSTLDSAFGKHIEQAGRKEFITTRNLNTVEKILEKTQTK